MSLTGKLVVAADIEQISSLDLGAATFHPVIKTLIELTDGAGANQANLFWTDQRTLAASASENLDLAGGLTDAFGATLTFVRVKGIIIEAAAANTNSVVVGGHGSAAFVNWVSDATDKLVVRPNTVFALLSGDATAYAVTATTGDMLTITNSAGGTSVTYKITIIGASS